MKEFSMEAPKQPETRVEQLDKKLADIIRHAENAIAVEVHGSGIGRPDEDTVSPEQLKAEEAETFSRFREELQDVLDGESTKDALLALFDAYAAGEKTAVELQAACTEVLHSSEEHLAEVSEQAQAATEAFTAAAAELPGFLDAKILAHQENRAVMAKWGNAKRAYEQGDSSGLKTVLTEHLTTVEGTDEAEKIEEFLNFLEQQRFEG